MYKKVSVQQVSANGDCLCWGDSSVLSPVSQMQQLQSLAFLHSRGNHNELLSASFYCGYMKEIIELFYGV